MKNSASQKITIIALMILIQVSNPIVTAQDSQVETDDSNEKNYTFHTLASLGDSTLGSDPTGYRGPFASKHAANLMGVEYYEGAVGGDRSTTLIEAGRHTQIAENYGEGTLVTIMVGAWDFIDSGGDLVRADYSFMDGLEENITIILDTLVASDIDVLIWNLPNMSFLPFLQNLYHPGAWPYFTEASFLWAERLDIIADSYGDSVQVFDLLTVSNDLLENQSARMVGEFEVIAPPEMCDKSCIMIDELHPTSVGQGLIANKLVNTINEKFPSPSGPYPFLTEEELLSLTISDDSENIEDEEELMTIEGDVSKACFDWTQYDYRQLYLTISKDGETVTIPRYIGYNTPVCQQATHVMYSGTNAIHVVSGITNNLTLNHFFEIWGQDFSETKVLDMEVGNGSTLAIFLDGAEFVGDSSSIPIADVISIDIRITSAESSDVIEDADDKSRSTPGFNAIFGIISLLSAVIIARKKPRLD